MHDMEVLDAVDDVPGLPRERHVVVKMDSHNPITTASASMARGSTVSTSASNTSMPRRDDGGILPGSLMAAKG